jgi:hypothetical protein
MEHSEQKSEHLNSMTALQPSGLKSQESGLFQFQDNRPQAAAHQKLQQLSVNSSQAKSLHAIQLMANYGTNTSTNKVSEKPGSLIMKTGQNNNVAPIQRAVITVNADRLISDSAQTVADVTGATAGAFSEVKPNETIHIFAHGYHSLTKLPDDENPKTNLEPELMGGITAAMLVQMMIEEGWTEEHKGPIDLRACMSGAESLLPSFAELFAIELKKNGRSNLVTGYKELSETTGGGEEISKKPTVSKMIEVAQHFDPSNLMDQFFAMDVISLFLDKKPDMEEYRLQCDDFGKTNPNFLIGIAPMGISELEWRVYSYYHALSNNNTALIKALKGNFHKMSGEINRVKNEPHDRQFNPEEMEVPVEEEVPVVGEVVDEGTGGEDDDLMSRLAALRNK